MSEELLEKMKSRLQDIFKVLEEYSYGSNCRVSAVYGHISDSIPNSSLGLLAPLYLQFHMIFLTTNSKTISRAHYIHKLHLLP